MRPAYYLRSKTSFILSTILLSAQIFPITLPAQPQTTAKSKPNVIFILGDDIGYYVPTINGGQSYTTPNIDSMARHGMNFTHCDASPLCSPSRFMFLTGKYNFRNFSNWGYMSDSEKTIANVMHDAGYVTGIFGKLQLPYQYSTMHNWGWDRHIVFELTEDTMKYRRYKNPVLMDNGYRIPDSITVNKYCDDILTQRILDFIDSNQTKPFFAYYSMSIGHDPFSPTPDDSAFATWNPYAGISDPAFFPSMIKYMDKKIGEILNKLRSTGLDQNTIVFYAGDNGTPIPIVFVANGVTMHGEKGQTTEGGTHVPMIAYWPGHIPEQAVNDDLIDLTDFLPTFADIAKHHDLTAYGALDGLSFYSRLFGQSGKTKHQLFFHYDPHPGGYDTLRRWTSNKTYKLYDSTGIDKSGKFYNTAKDVYEMSPLQDEDLTAKQLAIKETLKHILDTVGTWPACPRLTNPFVTNITRSSATIGATIISRGDSPLTDRGSNITTTKEGPFLNNNRLHDSIVSLGTFSQKRSGLLPQKLYKFDLYAMNSNLSHSTGFVYGQFYTLSNAPIRQPASFTATASDSVTTLAWDDAVFPKTGATKAGYLLVYSEGQPEISPDANGKPPAKIVTNGNFACITSANLPILPSKKIKLYNLTKAGKYNFLLIPYTWNGSTDSTYNYLSEDAREITAATAVTTNTYFSGIRITPNPTRTEFHITTGNDLVNKNITINVFDVSGKLVITMKGLNKSGYTFGKNFMPGTYFSNITAGDEVFKFKLLKQ